jgi:hypothetical protein
MSKKLLGLGLVAVGMFAVVACGGEPASSLNGEGEVEGSGGGTLVPGAKDNDKDDDEPVVTTTTTQSGNSSSSSSSSSSSGSSSSTDAGSSSTPNKAAPDCAQGYPTLGQLLTHAAEIPKLTSCNECAAATHCCAKLNLPGGNNAQDAGPLGNAAGRCVPKNW